MATVARPRVQTGPNIPEANIQLPSVESYGQVTEEIRRTLNPTKAWLAALLVAILSLLIGLAAWI